jgi:hypothetical protein
MWHSALTASLLLASQVSAGVLGDGTMEQKMRRFVDSIVDPIERRQSTTSTTNVTQWNAQTIASCTTALGALNGNASNPSGMAACYNIAYLEKSTGVFQADLQLFTISPPSGSFANIPSQNVMVKLQYSGAAVSAVNASSLMRRADAVSPISRPQSVDEMEKRQAAVPTIAQSYTFVGQINKNLLTSTTTMYVYWHS